MADRREEEERSDAEQEPQGAVGGEGMWSRAEPSRADPQLLVEFRQCSRPNWAAGMSLGL